ncbi:ABC transporter permease subunit [Clostridium sp. P21]|uniref:ABC transporter permease subunit n=1 Tax=Clostridium muellerianum TaxID=2716538 RepID=A0A7Y0EID2_9CLOT|nr:ABC transporter permease [Clostridium muellerianum]NMM64014.1 ABC transporter permease subunit [Clostridium muellerianum]
MNTILFRTEWSKLKRTGIITTMFLAGIFASLFAIISFKFRHIYLLSLPFAPMEILIGQTYPLFSFLNILAIIIGGCIIYNIEYHDNAIKRIMALPINALQLFIVKLGVMLILFLCIITIESLALIYTGNKFLMYGTFSIKTLLNFSAYVYLLSIPVIVAMTLICALCKNMWLSLGMGILGLISGLSSAAITNKINLINPFALIFQPGIIHTINPNLAISLLAVIEVVSLICISSFILKRKECDQ